MNWNEFALIWPSRAIHTNFPGFCLTTLPMWESLLNFQKLFSRLNTTSCFFQSSAHIASRALHSIVLIYLLKSWCLINIQYLEVVSCAPKLLGGPLLSVMWTLLLSMQTKILCPSLVCGHGFESWLCLLLVWSWATFLICEINNARLIFHSCCENWIK